MKKLLLLVLSLSLLFICGCYDAKDIDNMAYSLALGVDLTEDNDYSFTFQVVAPLNIKGGVETGFNIEGDGKPLINYSVSGKDFFECYQNANDRISKQLDLSQLKVIMFSENALLNRYENLKEIFENEKLFRDNIYICVCRGQAKDSLEHTLSPLELNPSKYYELIFSENSAERTVSASLWEFLKKDCFAIPLYTPSFEGLVPDGTYILNDGKISLHLTENETYFYNMLSGNIRTTRYKNSLLNLEKKPSAKTDFENKTLTYTIRIKCQKEKGGKYNTQKELKNGLNNVLNKLKTNNTDALQMKSSQKKYFLTFDSFEQNSLNISELDLKTNLIYHEINKEV